MSSRSGNKPAQSSRNESLERLRTELAAKTAETEWLRSHYEQHLREAMVKNEMLRSTAAASVPDTADQAARDRELRQLRKEVERLQAAEGRYLDRIAELKESLARDRSSLGPRK